MMQDTLGMGDDVGSDAESAVVLGAGVTAWPGVHLGPATFVRSGASQPLLQSQHHFADKTIWRA